MSVLLILYNKFRQEVNVDMNFEGDYVCEQVYHKFYVIHSVTILL